MTGPETVLLVLAILATVGFAAYLIGNMVGYKTGYTKGTSDDKHLTLMKTRIKPMTGDKSVVCVLKSRTLTAIPYTGENANLVSAFLGERCNGCELRQNGAVFILNGIHFSEVCDTKVFLEKGDWLAVDETDRIWVMDGQTFKAMFKTI